MERRIGHTPVLQVFCGKSVLPDWRCPDHTKIETLCNRLTPETHRLIGEYVLRVAQGYGFADASWLDVDSTVQEANVSYPADSTLMKKLCEKAHRVLTFLRERKKSYLPDSLQIDIERIRKTAQGYFLLARTAPVEVRRRLFKRYHGLVKRELRPVIKLYQSLSKRRCRALPWHIPARSNR